MAIVRCENCGAPLVLSTFDKLRLVVSDYSAKAVTVTGNTAFFADELALIGGTVIDESGDNPVWVFSRRKLCALQALVGAINKVM